MKIRRPASILTAALLALGAGPHLGGAAASAGEIQVAPAADSPVSAEVAGMDEGTLVLIIVGGTLGFIALSFLIAFWLGRRILRGSKKKQAEAKRLVETGGKARATILGIDPTGLVMNQINIQCRMRFRLDPLDGSPAFAGEKKAYVNQTRMPSVGDVWPSWYDLADRSIFAVGQPDLGDPSSVEVLTEFGIPHPLADTAPPSEQSSSARLDALERLTGLHAHGALSDNEFEVEKKRLLQV